MKTHVFHLGDYRRATVGPGQDVPDDYFFINGSYFLLFPGSESLDGAIYGETQWLYVIAWSLSSSDAPLIR